ncbi:MAG TPA: LCP family protein [Nocardioidaceae bacterium]|jgi:polyisoprenyl-teichoic acid--peptidoglycan teichoic acid transferase|nr:LCP family protein [Nocardioidaceae bacterium]
MTEADAGRDIESRAEADRRAEQARFRRSLSLMGMTLVLPGSAHLVAGNKRLGMIILRIWLVLVGVALFGVVLYLLDRNAIFSLATNTDLLLLARIVLILLAIAWILLLTDAWRLGDPLRLRRAHRAVMIGVNSTLCLVAGGVLLFSAHVVAVQRDFIQTVFGSGVASDPHDGRYNVLLLGGDSGKDRWGLRPDSITVASIDEDTGQTILFGIPRNLANVPFPDGSVMHDRFPDGYDCDACYINSLYTWGVDHPSQFHGYDDPGLEATIEGVEGVTGLSINYWAMVNLAGFDALVDALGGVTVDVPKPIPIGGIGGAITGTIPAGEQHLDGYQALWFARSRVADDDYSRMARQKCLMSAMLKQIDPKRVVLKMGDIADASKRVFKTDIPASALPTFIELALKARGEPIRTVSFVPPKIETYDPDYDKIREMVDDAFAKAEDGQSGGKHHRHGEEAANQTGDLAASC